MSTRVLVVDDTVLFRRIISEALNGMPGVEVVGTAPNGKLALARIASLRPDLVTLDIEMPDMDGLAVLRAMKDMSLHSAVIVLSSVTARGGETTVRALELGAFDFLLKPETCSQDEGLKQLRDQLLPLIRAFETKRAPRAALLPASPALPTPAQSRIVKRTGSPLVVIGVSTGGPAALRQLIPALPSDFPAPVFIVQHMPPTFTAPLADSLAKQSRVRVKEAVDGEIAQPGSVYLAPGGRQMKVAQGLQGEAVVRVTDDPAENNCRPSVDYLFRSVALTFPGRAIAAILTGMGNDGTAGLRMLKRGGCVSIAEHESSCVVFGMPREAIRAGVVDIVEPIDRIADVLIRSVREPRA